jgi:hypothetical protein
MSGLQNFFKKDDYVFGAFLGIVSPAVLLAIIHFAMVYVSKLNHVANPDVGKFYLLSLLLNILFIRYYLVNRKMVKTGKSIVAVTFIFVLLYFFFIGKV